MWCVLQQLGRNQLLRGCSIKPNKSEELAAAPPVCLSGRGRADPLPLSEDITSGERRDTQGVTTSHSPVTPVDPAQADLQTSQPLLRLISLCTHWSIRLGRCSYGYKCLGFIKNYVVRKRSAVPGACLRSRAQFISHKGPSHRFPFLVICVLKCTINTERFQNLLIILWFWWTTLSGSWYLL